MFVQRARGPREAFEGDFTQWALHERVEAAGLLGRAGGPCWSMLASARKAELAEAEVAAECLQRDNHVIALGGGTVMQDGVAELIKTAPDAKRIYLSCKPAVLAERIAADTASTAARPSLTGTAAAASVEEITTVLEERDPVYRDLADVTFDVSYVDLAAAVAYLTRHQL